MLYIIGNRLWSVVGGQQCTYALLHRYYHLFKQGELDDLFRQVEGVEIETTGYDRDNHYVIACKKQNKCIINQQCKDARQRVYVECGSDGYSLGFWALLSCDGHGTKFNLAVDYTS